MSFSDVPGASGRLDGRRAALLGGVAFLALAAATLAWAKWIPYVDRLQVTSSSGEYPGSDVLARAGAAGDAPSLAGAWAFTKAYALAVWPALVAALLIAAAIEAFLPRRWLLSALGHAGARGRLAGGLASTPSMMCTCCTAPVVATLRRNGLPTGTVLAYWLGNPVLNPAVLAFLAIVLPWEWVATRVLVGGLLVFWLTGVVARWAERREAAAPRSSATTSAAVGGAAVGGAAASDATATKAEPAGPPLRRFGAALLRMSVVLVPEYLVAVMLVGLLRGWLLPFDGSAEGLVLPLILVAAIAGTLLVIPTGGEIPLIAALAAGGAAAGPLGALLIALPAISLPSILMLGRALTWRVTLAAAGAVAAAAVLAGLLLQAAQPGF